MTQPLDRNTCIPDLRDPFGNKWKIGVSRQYPGLFSVSIEEGNGNTLPPTELRGHYTNHDRAKASLVAHLTAVWDKSDEQTARAKSRKPTETPESATASG
jgi:hypothetical protein